MATTFGLGKAELLADASENMRRELGGESWSLRQKIALTCRILYERGHASGLAGQISARGDSPDTYYTQRFGLGFEEITARNLLLVDEDLNVLDGQGVPNPANRFHSRIYRVRPDVACIVHTHARYTSALSMIGTPLIVSHMDTSTLWGDCAYLRDWPGIPFGNEEGRIISEALEDKRSILLAHHGLLVAGSRPEETCFLAGVFERAAELQLLAMAAGDIKPIVPELGREAHDWGLGQSHVNADFQYRARSALRRHSDCLE
ncbi:MAG: aldolase [Stellaceae bacterium]